MITYIKIIKDVLENGVFKTNRTKIKTKSILGVMFKHNMQDGFPLLTTKKMAFKSIKVELEGFIKGITKKKWYQERGCTIWDEWSSPYNPNDLGTIYGYQWRNFNGVTNRDVVKGDQLKIVLKELKENPNSRRLVVSAWNPLELDYMALPPCHFAFQLTTTDDKLNLTWYQRSCDVMLGLPFNIASYGLLLHIIAKQMSLKEGQLTGLINDAHIYETHLEGAETQVKRITKPLAKLNTERAFTTIFDWDYTQSNLFFYQYHEKIKLEVVV